jgi:replicative DNA helicase
MEQVIRKVPPQNLDAELSLLATLYAFNDKISEVNSQLGLLPSHFYRKVNQEIYAAFVQLDSKSEKVDAVTLQEVLRTSRAFQDAGGDFYLDKIIDTVPSSTNYGSYVTIIKNKANLRALIEFSQGLIGKAYEESDEARALLEEAERQIFSLNDTGQSGGFKYARDVADETFELVVKAIDNRIQGNQEVMGVPSGLRDLDKYTQGFQDADLIILGARPSMGKTALCLQIALNISVEQKLPTIIYSLEMPARALMARLFSQKAGIHGDALRQGLLTESQRKKLTQSMLKIGSSPLFINDNNAVTLYDIRNDVRRLERELKEQGSELRMIIIDYLQLITYRGRANSVQEQVAEISKGLKGIGREFNVPIICLSQLSRKVEDRANKRPMLSDLRESGAIEQDADLVMFLHREDYYDRKNDEIQGQAELILAKHRNGATGDIQLEFDKNTTSFKNVAKG